MSTETTCYVIFKAQLNSHSTGKSSSQLTAHNWNASSTQKLLHNLFLWKGYNQSDFSVPNAHLTFILLRTIALISSAAKVFFAPLTSTRTWGFLFFSITWNGKYFKSLWTDLSSHVLPINRLASKIVFSGFVVSWFFAPSPISRSPSGVKATYDGVIRFPCSFAMISTRPFLKTPTLWKNTCKNNFYCRNVVLRCNHIELRTTSQTVRRNHFYDM